MSKPSARDELEAVAATLTEIPHADPNRLSEIRIDVLGRKAGRLSGLLRSLGTLAPDERRELGRQANDLKKQVDESYHATVCGRAWSGLAPM